MRCKCGGKTITPKKVSGKKPAPKKVTPKMDAGAGKKASARSQKLSRQATKLATKKANSANNPFAKGCNCS